MVTLIQNNGYSTKRWFDGSKAEEYGSHDKTLKFLKQVLQTLLILTLVKCY